MYEQLKDKNWLKEQYVDSLRSLQDMANEVGCHKATVARALKRNGIERRKRTSKYPLLNDKAWLKKVYVEDGRTIQSIADEIGCAPGNVHSSLSALKIRTRSHKETFKRLYPHGRNGPLHGQWKGGRMISNGYVFVYQPDHPSTKGKRPYVQEHRLVMERSIGRYLEPYEVVHHLDGDRQNNDISNLELKTRGQHISEHFKASHEVLQLRQKVKELEKQLQECTDDRDGRIWHSQ